MRALCEGCPCWGQVTSRCDPHYLSKALQLKPVSKLHPGRESRARGDRSEGRGHWDRSGADRSAPDSRERGSYADHDEEDSQGRAPLPRRKRGSLSATGIEAQRVSRRERGVANLYKTRLTRGGERRGTENGAKGKSRSSGKRASTPEGDGGLRRPAVRAGGGVAPAGPGGRMRRPAARAPGQGDPWEEGAEVPLHTVPLDRLGARFKRVGGGEIGSGRRVILPPPQADWDHQRGNPEGPRSRAPTDLQGSCVPGGLPEVGEWGTLLSCLQRSKQSRIGPPTWKES